MNDGFEEFIEYQRANDMYPIIFVGSGLTRRYLNGDSWDELLNRLWKYSDSNNSYYARYDELSNMESNTYDVYTMLASELERNFNKNFFNGKVPNVNLTPEEAHERHISPFKRAIADYFKEIESSKQAKLLTEEESTLTDLLTRASTIITTNYDCFIENMIGQKNNVIYSGRQLSNLSQDGRVILKIHGSVEEPNSIVITREDYKKMSSSSSSSLITSELLERLRNSSILFLGYSLTDHDVQEFLRIVYSGLEMPNDEILNRVGFVNYLKDEQDIKSKLEITNNRIPFRAFETDNYLKVYQCIGSLKPISEIVKNSFGEPEFYGILLSYSFKDEGEELNLVLKKDRLLEYTEPNVKNNFKNLASNVASIKDIPWLVGTEYQSPSNRIYLANLQAFDDKGDMCIFSFKKIQSISWETIKSMSRSIGILFDSEMDRTHMSIKKVDLIKSFEQQGK